MKHEDCSHASPFVYHVDGRDPRTGAAKLRISYCADCAPLVKECRVGVAFDQARQSIPKTVIQPRRRVDGQGDRFAKTRRVAGVVRRALDATAYRAFSCKFSADA